MSPWDDEALAPLLDLQTPQEEAKEREERQTNAGILLSLCHDLSVHVFRAQDLGGHFARFPVAGHYEISGLRSQRFRAWLASKFYKAQGAEPKQADIEGALTLLTSEAEFDNPSHKVFTRLGEAKGKIYLDLCNGSYQAVEIDAEGWRVVDDSPVWFWRPPSMGELPVPQEGGSLAKLREFFNGSDEDFVLLVGWLLASLNPSVPYPILSISAEHGSGKSTLTGFLKTLIDPDMAGAVAPFKDADALYATAASRHVVGLDNLSRVTAEDSDSFCRLATGAGASRRKLYTDNESFDVRLRKPLILNGIDFTPDRADLLDRCWPISLLPLSTGRRLDSDLQAAFQAARPLLLGALCNAVSVALRMKGHPLLPVSRMLDAAAFVIRAEATTGVLPWKAGTFKRVLLAKETVKVRNSVQGSVVGRTVAELSELYGGWQGTPAELLGRVRTEAEKEGDNSCPKTVNWLGRTLSRLIPGLRASGVEVERGHTERGAFIRITKMEATNEDEDEDEVFVYRQPQTVAPQGFTGEPDDKKLCRQDVVSQQSLMNTEVMSNPDETDDKKTKIIKARGEKTSDTPDTPMNTGFIRYSQEKSKSGLKSAFFEDSSTGDIRKNVVMSSAAEITPCIYQCLGPDDKPDDKKSLSSVSSGYRQPPPSVSNPFEFLDGEEEARG